MPAKKATAYKVIGAVAVIRKDKHERYVDRGGIFAADALDEANAKHLLNAGLIEPFDLPDAEADAAAAAKAAEKDAAKKKTAAEEDAKKTAAEEDAKKKTAEEDAKKKTAEEDAKKKTA